MKHLKVFLWYWVISMLVLIAMYVAGVHFVISTAFSYYGTFVAFNAAEKVRLNASAST